MIRKSGEKDEKENISAVVCTCRYSASGNRSTDRVQHLRQIGVSKGDGIQQTEEAGAAEKHAPKIDGLEYKKTMKLKYATGFDVYYYKEGYKLLDVHEDRQYLIVPEGKKKPADLDKEIVVLKQPLEHIYLAATSAMALFDAMDGLDSIRMSGSTGFGLVY